MAQNVANIVARDIMVTRLVTLSPDMDVFKAIEMLVKNKISGAPVVDAQKRLLGVFSEKCCMQVLIDAAYEGLPANRVEVFMETDPRTAAEETSLLSIAQVFLITPRRRLPVVRDGILVGQISRRDVIRHAIKTVQNKSIDRGENSLLYLSAIREMNDAPMKN